jgi:hypothetical protein
MSESVTQTAILDWLKRQQDVGKLIYWRVPLGGVRHGGVTKKNPMKGMPDVCGVLRGGRYFAIEVKDDVKCAFNRDQVDWALKLQKIGALYLVATTLEDVVKALS